MLLSIDDINRFSEIALHLRQRMPDLPNAVVAQSALGALAALAPAPEAPRTTRMHCGMAMWVDSRGKYRCHKCDSKGD